MASKQKVRLENWRAAELSNGTVLIGEIYGHPVIKDGTKITTNPLSIKALYMEYPWAETNSVHYELGKRA